MEVIVVLGIVLVAIVVIFYSLKDSGIFPTNVPEGIYEQQKEVAESVKKVITDATDKTVGEVMSHGGYLETRIPGANKAIGDAQSTEFMLTDVAFWQRCDNTMYPKLRMEEGTDNMEAWMAASIKKKVSEGMDDIEVQYGNRAKFDLSGLRVEVDIKGSAQFEPDVIDVTVTMPTEVRDYKLPSDLHPYKVSFKSKLGRIHAFGKDFAVASREKRFFDWFSIEAILFSQELENTHAKLPTQGIMTQCGEVVYRSSEQINDYLLEMVGYIMSSVVWWEDNPNLCPGGACQDKRLSFGIQDLDGVTFDDLEIRAMLVDDWEFGLTDYMMATNFEMPTHGGYTVPICTASYNKAYEFTYPYVLRVKDPYTGYSFNMAYEASVKDSGDETMEPGDCGEAVASTDCSGLQWRGTVRVVDEDGRPLEGVAVVFGGCPLGETDTGGRVSGYVKCGMHELAVFGGSEREFFERDVTATTLNSGYTVTLNPVNAVTIHFREVTIEDSADCDACSKNCNFGTGVTCEISGIGREMVHLEFDNGYMKVPVSNVNVEDMDDECRTTPDCVFCNANYDSMEGVDPEDIDDELAQDISDACLSCDLGCPKTLTEHVTVDYLPSGYEYSVNGNMNDPLLNRMETGELNGTFYLGPDDTELYVYMVKRADDRKDPIDAIPGDSEITCLMNALAGCGIGPVSTVDYSSPIIVTS